jgi:hypothetical protein
MLLVSDREEELPSTATINLGSAGVIPVAILSSATCDATQVDPSSVSPGAQ